MAWSSLAASTFPPPIAARAAIAIPEADCSVHGVDGMAAMVLAASMVAALLDAV
jgi:hypothetical protein